MNTELPESSLLSSGLESWHVRLKNIKLRILDLGRRKDPLKLV